jgi:hypothetical protein
MKTTLPKAAAFLGSLQKCILFIALANGLAACQAPATANDLKKVAEGSAFGKVENFSITKSSMKEIHARLNEYAERCLSREMVAVQCGINCSRSTFATYHPHFETRQEGLRFVLQRKDKKGIDIYHLPEKGMYVMVAEAEQDKGKMTGHVWGTTVGYGDLTGATRGWMTGEDKKCPDLP